MDHDLRQAVDLSFGMLFEDGEADFGTYIVRNKWYLGSIHMPAIELHRSLHLLFERYWLYRRA